MNPTLAIIPARGGSRGIPHKNRAAVGGKPLIAWTIAAARLSLRIDHIVVTTDCERIAELAKSLGAQVPFRRSAKLARDDTPGIAPILDTLDRLRSLGTPEPGWVVQLQPTSPLRTAADIDAALQIAESSDADSVVSVTLSSQHPDWTQRIDAEGRLQPFLERRTPPRRRQELAPAYALNGAIGAARPEALRERAGFLGPDTAAYVMPAERSIDVDAPLDLEIADFLLRRGDTHPTTRRALVQTLDDPSEIALGETR